MLAPLHAAPFAYFLIAAMVAVSVAGLRNRRLFEALRMHPYSLYRGKRPFTALTSVFVHVDERHLLINGGLLCLSLPEIEYMLIDDFGPWIGRLLMLMFLTLSSAFAALLAAIQHRRNALHWSAGASAVILAAFMFFLMYFPVDPILGMPSFFTDIRPLWIAFVILLVLVVQLCLRGPAGAIHLYGALAGMLLAFLIRPVSLTEISIFVLEESDNESAWYNHSTDYTDDSPTEQRSLPAFTALDGFRLFDVEAVHPRWDLQG